MIFKSLKNQTSYGEAIGVLLLDSSAPFIQGDVGNATSYAYPVRFKRVDGLTVERIFAHDRTFVDKMVAGAQKLEREGVKAITGDCGFMAIYQEEVKKSVDIPVLLSSLLQLPFMRSFIHDDAQIGILTANSRSLTPKVFAKLGMKANDSIVIHGLEGYRYFREAAIEENGELDSDKIRVELVDAARELIAAHPKIKSILLECSMLPPYAFDVQKATNLPVYDFLTMIDFVYSAVVKKKFSDTI